MIIALDTETDNTFYPFCVTEAWRDSHGVLNTAYHDLRKHNYTLDPRNTYVFHNAKFDLLALWKAGCIVDMEAISFHDTETMAHLINEHAKRGLKHLAREELGMNTTSEEALKQYIKDNKMKKSDGYDKIPDHIIQPYARDDALYTLLLYEKYEASLPKDLDRLYKLELKVTRVLLRMEQDGMKIDLHRLEELHKEYSGKLLDLELELRRMVNNDEFNPNSPQQVKKVLLEQYGLHVPGTGEEVLLAIESESGSAFVNKLLEYRGTSKILRTYIEALRREVQAAGGGYGILTPNFRQHGARTGRMSSGAIQTGD